MKSCGCPGLLLRTIPGRGKPGGRTGRQGELRLGKSAGDKQALSTLCGDGLGQSLCLVLGAQEGTEWQLAGMKAFSEKWSADAIKAGQRCAEFVWN